FRLAGVDKDSATREKIKALRDELVLIGQEFARNIRDDKKEVVVENVSDLTGLPQDFIDSHQPDANGKIVLTIDYPDFIPVMTYRRVKQGVLDVNGELFCVKVEQVKHPPVWHPSVECWEMVEDGKLVGRFYLDMHPRERKYHHAAEFGGKTAVRRKQIPQGTL